MSDNGSEGSGSNSGGGSGNSTPTGGGPENNDSGGYFPHGSNSSTNESSSDDLGEDEVPDAGPIATCEHLGHWTVDMASSQADRAEHVCDFCDGPAVNAAGQDYLYCTLCHAMICGDCEPPNYDATDPYYVDLPRLPDGSLGPEPGSSSYDPGTGSSSSNSGTGSSST